MEYITPLCHVEKIYQTLYLALINLILQLKIKQLVPFPFHILLIYWIPLPPIKLRQYPCQPWWLTNPHLVLKFLRPMT